MATNVLIAYPAIPFLATSQSIVLGSIDSSSDLDDLATGSRSNYVRFTAAISGGTYNFIVEYDLGLGNTSSSDYLIIARADLIIAPGGTWTIKHQTSTDDITYTDRESDSNVTTSDLYNPENEDFLATNAGGVSTRYHRIVIEGTQALTASVSKFYCGPAFDFGVDPVYPRRLERETRSKSDRRAKYKFTLLWRGVTNAIRNSFYSKIGRYKDINPVFLYTTTYHDVFNEHRLLHCLITSIVVDPRTRDRSDISITFEELI